MLVSLLVSVVAIVLLAVLFTDMFYRNTVSLTEQQHKDYMNVLEEEYSPSEAVDSQYAQTLTS